MAQIPDSLSKKVLVLRGGILLVYTLECTLRISKGTGGGVRGGCRSARSIAVFYMWGGGQLRGSGLHILWNRYVAGVRLPPHLAQRLCCLHAETTAHDKWPSCSGHILLGAAAWKAARLSCWS